MQHELARKMKSAMTTSEYSIERIYKDYGAKVLGYARSKISNPQDAEDVCSTVFLKIQQGLPFYDSSVSSLSTWIYAIARNTVIDFYRRARPVEQLNEEVVIADDTFESIFNEEMLEELAAALEKLPQRECNIILLHYYSGKSLKETAELMKISYSNVKIPHKKALAHLKRQMQFEL